MKRATAIQARLITLKIHADGLKTHAAILSARRHAEAAKVMQRETAIRDQIALLEWVLKD